MYWEYGEGEGAGSGGQVEGFMVVCRRRLDQNPDGSGSGSRVASVAQRH